MKWFPKNSPNHQTLVWKEQSQPRSLTPHTLCPGRPQQTNGKMKVISYTLPKNEGNVGSYGEKVFRVFFRHLRKTSLKKTHLHKVRDWIINWAPTDEVPDWKGSPWSIFFSGASRSIEQGPPKTRIINCRMSSTHRVKTNTGDLLGSFLWWLITGFLFFDW